MQTVTMVEVVDPPAGAYGRTVDEEREWRRLHCGDFKRYPQRGQWPPPTLWRVHNWLKGPMLNTSPIGFLVTSNWSKRLPQCVAPWPRPIAFVPTTGAEAMDLVKVIRADESYLDKPAGRSGPALLRWGMVIDCRGKFPPKLYDMVLFPARADGTAMKIGRLAFPAHQYVPMKKRGGGELPTWYSHTQYGLRLLTTMHEQKKSGRSEPSNAATPAKQSSKSKGVVTAA